MALNKERKVLLGLLGSAGLILTADQLLLGPPQGAKAGQATPTVQPLPAPQAEAGDTAIEQIAAPKLPLASGELIGDWNERLSEATTENVLPSGIADPFSTAQREAETTGVLTPLMFKQQHELSSVITGGDIGVAMVNKKPVRVGQTVAGYRLISVDTRSAVFQAGDTTVRLTLPVQGTGGS